MFLVKAIFLLSLALFTWMIVYSLILRKPMLRYLNRRTTKLRKMRTEPMAIDSGELSPSIHIVYKLNVKTLMNPEYTLTLPSETIDQGTYMQPRNHSQASGVSRYRSRDVVFFSGSLSTKQDVGQLTQYEAA